MTEDRLTDSTTTAYEQTPTSPKGVESTAPTQTEAGLTPPAATPTQEEDGQLDSTTEVVDDSTMSTTARGKSTKRVVYEMHSNTAAYVTTSAIEYSESDYSIPINMIQRHL